MDKKRREAFTIDRIPALLWGEPSRQVYCCLHGQGGCKEEAEFFAGIAADRGWQVLSVDLPEPLEPWYVVPGLKQVFQYARRRWSRVALFANSIGAWFGMQALAGDPPEKALFVSPILDMERLIRTMMLWANVTEEQLREQRVIPTSFGQTLSWEYLRYAREHPVTDWSAPTEILYAGQDNMTARETVDEFAARFHAGLTVIENGEHWFHTPEQLAVLEQWEKTVI